MDVNVDAKACLPHEALLSRKSASSQTSVRDTPERLDRPRHAVDEVDSGDCDDGSGATRPSTGQEKGPESNRSTIEQEFLRARQNAATVQDDPEGGILPPSEPEDGNVLPMQINKSDTNLPPLRPNPTLSRHDARLVANRMSGWDIHHSLGLPLDHVRRVTRPSHVERQAVLRIFSSYDGMIQHGCPQIPHHGTQARPVSLRAIHNRSVGQDIVANKTAETRELSHTSEV